MEAQELIFTVSITCISRLLALRDRLLGRTDPSRCGSTAEALVSRLRIPSGPNLLDAAFVEPATQPIQVVVLICHGIGETLEHWIPVQQLLAANGAASLAFDYSGYGRSTGRVDASQCEEDAISAFLHLQSLVPSFPVALLGFSLGSGVAVGIVRRVAAHRLVLCAAFTSFREAVHSVGIPRYFVPAMPDIWSAVEALPDCSVPVLIVHGEKDDLFPVRMASDLKALCGPDSELHIIPDLSHNQPFYEPHLDYWGLILSRLVPEEQIPRVLSRASR